jgi:hypothetical protein
VGEFSIGESPAPSIGVFAAELEQQLVGTVGLEHGSGLCAEPLLRVCDAPDGAAQCAGQFADRGSRFGFGHGPALLGAAVEERSELTRGPGRVLHPLEDAGGGAVVALTDEVADGDAVARVCEASSLLASGRDAAG